MQEDVENRTVTLIINTAKLTGRELKQAIGKFLAHTKNKRQTKAAAQPHGKMTVKQFAAQNKGMQSIEVNDKNIGSVISYGEASARAKVFSRAASPTRSWSRRFPSA